MNSFLTLAAAVMQNPQESRAFLDIRLMKMVLDFFSQLESGQSNETVSRLLRVCTEFQKISEKLVEKAHTASDLPLSLGPRYGVASKNSVEEPPTLHHLETSINNSINVNVPAPTVRQAFEIISQNETAFAPQMATNHSSSATDFHFAQFTPQLAVDSQSFVEAEPLLLDNFWQVPVNLEWDWTEGMDFGFPANAI
jgi:hypothetical protein